MEDIAPRLLMVIRNDFESQFGKSDLIATLYKKIQAGTASYVEANDFAIEAGKILASAFRNNLSSEVLPNGKLYYNIAKQIVEPMMKNNYTLITDVTDQVQETLNEAAGIGIKPITPELNQDRIDGILDKTSSAEVYDEVAWVLDEPIVNFSQSVVDEAIKANAEFHARAGLKPKIIRKVAGDCCDWCKNLAGTYSYPNDVTDDVYRRHQRCRCSVDYIPGDGKVQNAHTKKWQSQEEYDKIKIRKRVGLADKKIETPEERERRIKFGNIDIPEEKFKDYALNFDKSLHKAIAFRDALGYDLDNYQELIKNIQDHIDFDKFIPKGNSGYGMRYEQIMKLTGPNGKEANVLTAWIQEGSKKRMTSVYVTKKEVTE